MTEAWVLRPMNPGEENGVSRLVARVFDEFVGPGYSVEGRQEFLKYAQPDALRHRSASGHFTLLTVVEDEIVGMIEVRDNHHVSLLFVEPRFHRRGIARGLLQRALELCLRNKPNLREIDVNSSPYAVGAYERMGFSPTGPAEVRNGIEFVPMVMEVVRGETFTHLALLRGINVGGKNKLPMKDLVQLFVAAGCGDVRSYIQSGNVVFSADQRLAETVPARVTAAIAERFGIDTPIVLRTAEQLHKVIRSNPFLQAGAPEDALHVLFLADQPDAHRVDSLDPNRSRPDAFAVRGREIYLWLPNGVARSKLTNDYFDSKLATTSTARNWRTVIKLFEMMKG